MGLALVEDEADKVRRIRRYSLISLTLVVGTFVTTVLVAGDEYPWIIPFMGVPAALGVIRAVQLLLHPDRVGHLPRTRQFDEITSRGGVDLSWMGPNPESGEVRLVLQDTLDAIRTQRGSRRLGMWARVAAAAGVLGWLGGAVVSVVVAGEPVAATICVAAATFFGGWGVFLERMRRRLGAAEAVVEDQLSALPDGDAPELPGDG